MNAIGALGLALYNYGQTVSIPFFTETWKPASWSERIFDNRRLGLHTLCLLDIKVKEQSEENMARSVKLLLNNKSCLRYAKKLYVEAEKYLSHHASCRLTKLWNNSYPSFLQL